jgi:hypothetical protein
MIWDFIRQQQIDQLKLGAYATGIDIKRSQMDHERLVQQVRALEVQIDRLTLALATVTELFCERNEITQEQLAEKIREIDLRDGKLDGKISRTENKQVKKCSSCQGVNNELRHTCLYCDKALPQNTISLPAE